MGGGVHASVVSVSGASRAHLHPRPVTEVVGAQVIPSLEVRIPDRPSTSSPTGVTIVEVTGEP